MAQATDTSLGEIQLQGDLAGDGGAQVGTNPQLTHQSITPGQYDAAKITVNVKGIITAIEETSGSELSALLPDATSGQKGVVSLGDNITDGTGCEISIPDATVSVAGVVQIGSGIIDNGNGLISVDLVNFTPATTTTLGGVIVPTSGNLDVDGSGNISVPIATDSLLGVVQIPGGDGLSVDGSGNVTFAYTAATDSTSGAVMVPTSGNLDVDGSGNISVPIATDSVLGVVKIGGGLQIDGAGLLEIDPSSFPIATTTTLGVVQVPTSGNIDIDGSGNISVPDATGAAKGVVQVGTNINVSSGTISVDDANGTSTKGIVKSADANNIVISSGDINIGPDVVTLDTTQTWTGAQVFSQDTLTSTSNQVAVDADDGNSFYHALTENTTLQNPTNLNAGQEFTFTFEQDSTARTLGFGSVYKFPGGTTPTVSSGSGDIDVMRCISDGTNMYCEYYNDYS